MATQVTNWKPTEQVARKALENLHDDLVPMRMLFSDAKYFSQNTWDSRFDAVFKTQYQWNLLSNYADGRRWSTMKDEDVELFDFWLIDWYDYEKWIRGAQRPDHIAHEPSPSASGGDIKNHNLLNLRMLSTGFLRTSFHRLKVWCPCPIYSRGIANGSIFGRSKLTFEVLLSKAWKR